MVFATSPVPFLRELVQKPSGKNLLAEPPDQNLFALVVSQPRGTASRSRVAAQAGIDPGRPSWGQSAYLDPVSRIGAGRRHAGPVKGVLDDAEPSVRWSVAVDNPSRQRLVAVDSRCYGGASHQQAGRRLHHRAGEPGRSSRTLRRTGRTATWRAGRFPACSRPSSARTRTAQPASTWPAWTRSVTAGH